MQVKDRIFYLIIAVMLIITTLLGSLALIAPVDQAQAQYNTACYEEFGGVKRVAGSGCEYEFQSGAVVDIQDGATFNIGTGLYPLGYASAGQEMVCGTTATFTGTLEVTSTGLTTTTYVIASQITTPAAGAVFLTVSDPTTSTFVLSSWESDYSAGTTGITAHYCAVGNK